MLETPVFEASAPPTWGAEGIFLPTEEIRISPEEEILNNSATLMVVEQTLNMETSYNSDFNTLTSALNTPEITDFAFDGKLTNHKLKFNSSLRQQHIFGNCNKNKTQMFLKV